MSPDDTADASPSDPLGEFLSVMRRLRAECPWKREQTHRSLARYLLEETHETLEALDTGSVEHLQEELGDLLLQIFFHAVIAEEAREFTIDDVARGITEKMVRRNPLVFGDSSVPAGVTPLDAREVNELWESVKAAEKDRSSVTEGIASTLPALLYADKVLDRLERAGRTGDLDKLDHQSDDFGDRLLALVAEARATNTDPEQALRDAVRRLLPK